MIFLFLAILTGHISKGKNLYVSRASGSDDWSCDKKKPCKTIWRAVTLASRGDHLHLESTNTEKDPYTCQSGTSSHPGIFINKSLSLIGFGSEPPHIRCSEGNKLMFDGSDNAQQMDITLFGLFLSGSFVYFQDSSVNIDSVRLEGGKSGVKFLISTRMVSTIQITNSTFVGKKECISVILNSTKNVPHQRSQVIFKVKNSTFSSNVISDKVSCVSFSEATENSQSVSCTIILDNVTFSHNTFSSRGLFFLELENGNQNIKLNEVNFVNNVPLSDQDVLTDGHSECIIRSNFANIIVNASNFTSQKARSFSVSASTTLFQIYKSRFRDNKVESKGGVISIRGAELCKLNVSNSSFVNTTAGRGGAFNIECAKVRFSLYKNIFTENMALQESGGTLYIDALDTGLNSHKYATHNRPALSEKSEQHLQIDVTKCSFMNSYSFTLGGAIFIDSRKNVLHFVVENSSFLRCESSGIGGSLSIHCENEIQINIKNSHFISNNAVVDGGGLYVNSHTTSDQQGAINASQIILENSTFLNNTASFGGGGAMCVVANRKSTVILHEVTMESNRARFDGGGLSISNIFALKISQSRFLKNKAGGSGAVLGNSRINRLEVQDSLFEDNFGGQGGALSLTDISIPITISIFNTTFRNCSAQMEGGAIYLIHEGKNVSLVVQRSWFIENHSLQHLGGAIFLSLQPATEKGPGCDVYSRKNDDENLFLSTWKNDLQFENVRFVRNTGGVGGAVYLTTGDATLRHCHFVDNFASSQGGHIYTAYGNASLTIQGCLFLQTMKELHLGRMNYSKVSFIHAESSGTLIISKTTMDVRAYGSANPLMLITDSRLIDVGNDDNLTKFYCPIGSQMGIINFTAGNRHLPESMVTTLELSCSTCTGNSYSLQRGRALGSHVDGGFQCLPCPFGANCTHNILAKRNFWGFQEQHNPPTLRFSMCPVGYCITPQETNFPEYNSCQGNRSGDLCGNCSVGYTETLYSTHCRPSHQCNDYWFWPVALTYVSLLALYFTFKPPLVPWIRRQILWFRENELEDQDNNFDKGYLKILFYFYQAAGLLLVSKYLQYPNKENAIEPIVGVFNFKVFSSRLICPFPGLTVVTKQLFSASHVLGILLVICALYIIHRGIQRIRGREVPSAVPYIGGILQTMLLGYTSLATVSFSLLRCVPIGSERRLFYDGNVVCFQWWQYIFIAYACTFVVPFVFVLLWGSFKLYGGTLSVEKFLLACFFPLPSLIYWLFMWFSRVIGYSVNCHSSSWQVSKESVERVLYDPFKRPEDGSKLSLSWESIMIGRRLILVMTKTLVSDPLNGLLVMNLFCVMFLLHHVLAQPFRDSIANITETISLLSIVVLATGNVFFASFLSLAVPLNEDHFSSSLNFFHGVEIAILCFVPFMFSLFVVAAILSQLCRLAVVVCRVVCNVCSRCFRSSYNNENDEGNPLLVSVS